MGFLCEDHRQKVNASQQRATSSWQKAMMRARKRVALSVWDEAVMFYGSALEISEIALSKQSNDQNTERYIQTSVELMHALRNSEHSADALALFQMILRRLDNEPKNRSVGETLRPLKDVTFEPLKRVNEWMSKWHSLVHNNLSRLH